MVLSLTDHLAESGAMGGNWMDAWPQVQARLMGEGRILLALDFDGIVTPLTPQPDEVNLESDIRSLLVKLSASPRVSLALISGRSLRDLEAKVGLPEVIYAGNHGMEIRGAGLACADGLASSCRSDLVDAFAFLTRFARHLRGVRIEDKGLSVTAHWRQAAPEDRLTLKNLLDVILRSHPRLQVFAGEMTWNIRGRASWDKSSALQQILDHLRLSLGDLVYLAEGATEERTLARLAGGLTFCAAYPGGTAAPAARYHLSSRMEVMQLLFCMLYAANSLPLS